MGHIYNLPDILAVDYFSCVIRQVQHTPTADTVHTTSTEHDDYALCSYLKRWICFPVKTGIRNFSGTRSLRPLIFPDWPVPALRNRAVSLWTGAGHAEPQLNLSGRTFFLSPK
jgi:hypothetical protein